MKACPSVALETSRTTNHLGVALDDTKSTLAKDTIDVVMAYIAVKADPGIPLPYIDPRSLHFRYAVLIAHGYNRTDACHIVGCSPRTAERWERELRAAAIPRYGFAVTYNRVALDIVTAAIAKMQGRRSLSQQHRTV